MKKMNHINYIKEQRLIFQNAPASQPQPGILDKLKGMVNDAMTCSTAEIEPEMQPYLATVAWVDKPDKKGTVVRYAVIARQAPDPKDPTKTVTVTSEYDIFTFNVYMYQQQITILQQKLLAPKAKIQAYTTEIRKIEGYIKQQEATHQRHEIKVIGERERLDALLKEDREGLGTRFEKGDLEEVAIKEKIEAMKKGMTDLKDKSTIYSGYTIDIDNPTTGQQYFADIRDLLAQYKARVKEIEDLDVEPLNDRIKCNTAQLAKAQTDYQQYQLYLRSP